MVPVCVSQAHLCQQPPGRPVAPGLGEHAQPRAGAHGPAVSCVALAKITFFCVIPRLHLAIASTRFDRTVTWCRALSSVRAQPRSTRATGHTSRARRAGPGRRLVPAAFLRTTRWSRRTCNRIASLPFPPAAAAGRERPFPHLRFRLSHSLVPYKHGPARPRTQGR